MQSFVFCLFMIFNLSCYAANVIETPSFRKILDYLSDKEDMLVVLDIDDTILIPEQTLGDDRFFNYRLKYYLESGLTKACALDKALGDWEAIRHLTRVKLVETDTAEIIAAIQENKVAVMGLTTQGLSLASRTTTQLSELGVDLRKTAPSSEHFYFRNPDEGVLYRDGLLSTAGTHKGKALLEFLNLSNRHYKKVLFINDKHTHLTELQTVLLAHNIATTCLRYSYLDSKIELFSEALVDYQWNNSTFAHLISDHEALKAMQKLQKH